MTSFCLAPPDRPEQDVRPVEIRVPPPFLKTFEFSKISQAISGCLVDLLEQERCRAPGDLEIPDRNHPLAYAIVDFSGMLMTRLVGMILELGTASESGDHGKGIVCKLNPSSFCILIRTRRQGQAKTKAEVPEKT